MPASGTVRFNQTTIEGHELQYMESAIRSGRTSSGGSHTTAVEDLLSDWHEGASVLLTTSCTDALEMVALLLDCGPGDRVIVPSFTFVSTALAFTRTGAEVVFADIEPRTLALDPRRVAQLLDGRTKAVVTVHYGGIAGELDELQHVVGDDVALVEDNAHGLFARKGERPLGTFGRFSTLSFHETKNFVCGEGGALVVNDPGDADRARVLLDKGTNRQAFFEGRVDKYNWRDTGSSFGLSNVLAGYLRGQLEVSEKILSKRKQVFDSYMRLLEPGIEAGITLPTVPSDCTPGYHLFYLLAESPEERSRLMKGLEAEGIRSTFHYVPLHSSPAGLRFGSAPLPMDVTDDVSSRLLRLPFHNALSEGDVERVATAVLDLL